VSFKKRGGSELPGGTEPRTLANLAKELVKYSAFLNARPCSLSPLRWKRGVRGACGKGKAAGSTGSKAKPDS